LIDFLIAELKAMPKVVPSRKKAGKTRPLTAGPKGGKGPTFALDATSRPKTAPAKRDPQDEEEEQGAAANADAGAGVVAAVVESRTYKEKEGVEAQKNNGVKWYAGHVLTAEQEGGVLTGYYTIKYSSGEAEEHVAGARLRPWQAGADGCQDVEIQYRGGSKFYAATITATTQEGDARFFTATYIDGRSETGVSESRVRSRSTGLGVLEVGESVESQYRRGRKWFSATITAVGTDGNSVDVLYADGDVETGVATSRVRSLESGAPVSTAVVKNLRPGSRVECSMTAEGGVISGWRIGTIASLNADGSYEVTMDAGDSDYQVSDERLRVLEGFAPVEVRYHRGAKWYPAVVTSDNGDGTFDVDYDDGDSELRMPAKYIRSKGVLMTGSGEDDVAGSPAKKATADAAAFEKVGSPVKARYKGGRKWFEGNVSGVNRDGTFNIRYDFLYALLRKCHLPTTPANPFCT
jgi:hypothetical protein